MDIILYKDLQFSILSKILQIIFTAITLLEEDLKDNNHFLITFLIITTDTVYLMKIYLTNGILINWLQTIIKYNSNKFKVKRTENNL